MIQSIRHVGIVVADLEKALYFWSKILGLRVYKRMDESGPHIDAMMGLRDVEVTTVKLSDPDGSMIELLHFHSHPDKKQWLGTPFSTGITHIAFTVTDIDSIFRDLSKEGVSFPAEPQLSPDGAVKVIYASAPDGVLLELVQPLT